MASEMQKPGDPKPIRDLNGIIGSLVAQAAKLRNRASLVDRDEAPPAYEATIDFWANDLAELARQLRTVRDEIANDFAVLSRFQGGS